MFKKFVAAEHTSTQTPLKSSVQRATLKRVADQYADMAPETLEVVVPKKSQLIVVKCQNHLNLVVAAAEGSGSTEKQVLFFNQREGPYYPCLRLLHRTGDIMQKVYVDAGAIRPLIGGAALMCPGINKEMLGDFEADTPVQIMSEGKVLPFAVGITKLSSKVIRDENAGIGVEILHTLGDGLWNCPTVE